MCADQGKNGAAPLPRINNDGGKLLLNRPSAWRDPPSVGDVNASSENATAYPYLVDFRYRPWTEKEE